MNLFINYYEKYNKRHLRVQHNCKVLYTTLFNVEILKITEKSAEISGKAFGFCRNILT